MTTKTQANQAKEAVLPAESGDSFAIYQLKRERKTRLYRCESLSFLRSRGLAVEKGNYDLVCVGKLTWDGSTDERLEKLFIKTHLNLPRNFDGHSLTISDVVILCQNGVISCHYCDMGGFFDLPGFPSGKPVMPPLLPARAKWR